MICLSCGYNNDPGDVICMGCGYPIGNENPKDWKPDES